MSVKYWPCDGLGNEQEMSQQEEYTDELTDIHMTIERDIPDHPKITVVCPQHHTLTIEQINEAFSRLRSRAGLSQKQLPQYATSALWDRQVQEIQDTIAKLEKSVGIDLDRMEALEQENKDLKMQLSNAFALIAALCLKSPVPLQVSELELMHAMSATLVTEPNMTGGITVRAQWKKAKREET